MTERRHPDTASTSFSDATSVSGAGPSTGGGGELSHQPRTDAAVIMEGVLKKRGANLPVMRDRYCVATWEVDQTHSNFVLLRTYKNHKSYTTSPEKPVSSHSLKCFGEWDGKGNFHRYEHAFLMETSESKVFFCTAPTEAEKRRWIDVMKHADAVAETPVVLSASSIGGESELKQSKRKSSARPSVAKRQSSHARNGRSSAFQSDSEDDDDGEEGLRDDEHEYDDASHSVTDSEHSPDDSLFRSNSGADSALNGLDDDGVSKAEPADWGIYGENLDGPTVSRYDIVDTPVLLLDEELLHEKVDKTALASDSFLFDDAGPSRFGAVVIKKSEGDSDDDLADFVDEGLAARLEREKSEKLLKKRAQKLESNRDLYAEMAAARLNSMRKDARQPKKSPRESSIRPSQFIGDASEYYASDDGYSHLSDDGHERNPSEVDLFEAEVNSVNLGDEMGGSDKVHDEGQPYEEEGAAVAEREGKKKKKKKKALEPRHSVSVDSVSMDERQEEVLEKSEIHVSYARDVEEEAVKAQRKKSKSKKPSRDETPIEIVDPPEELLVFESPDSPQQGAEEEEERRRLEKQRRREEKRARKEKQRREEEDAATAAAAAELARLHREEMRAREEEKARKREKKERKERRERAKLDKEKKQRKAKEAELQAEVERLKFAQLQQKAEDEKKEKKKKRRDKEKYSTPAERIHRKEKEAEAHAAEMSNALVVVESAPSPAAASPPTPTLVPAPASAPTATQLDSASVVAVTAPASEPFQPSIPVSIAPSSTTQEHPKSVFEQQASPTPTVAPAPQSAPGPAYPMMPQYIPGYPAPPQSLPLYASPPYGAYHPQFPPQSYYPPQYANLAYPPAAMPPQYFQPPIGYMPGPPMIGQPYPPSYPEMAASFPGPQNSSNDDEPAFIGPKLPSPKVQGASAPSAAIGPPPPPPPASNTNASRSTSPALPDLPDLPDIADF